MPQDLTPQELHSSSRPALKRHVAALAALLLTISPLASARGSQNEPVVTAATAELVFDIYQAGSLVGETGMSLNRSSGGATIPAYLNLPGLISAESSLEVNADGSARAYWLRGESQGAAFEMEVAFTAAGADLTLMQGGATQRISLPSEAPLYLFDNNFLSGFQVAARQVLIGEADLEFAALIPQSAALATVTLGAPEAASVEIHGVNVEAKRLAGRLEVAGQTLNITLYVDEAGDLLAFEQQPGAVRFLRRQGAAESQGNAEDPVKRDSEADAAPTQRGGAVASALADAAACLVERELSVTSEGAVLTGKLTLPKAAAEGASLPAPALLLLPGSGAVDMDGNVLPQISNAFYQQLAYQLSCGGYGVLRVAKLGIPPSTGDANAVTLDTYAANSAAWLKLLAEQPGVATNRVGVIGHSEGGLIALYTIAEALIDPAAVVLIGTAGRPLGELIIEQTAASLERAGLSEEARNSMMRQLNEALNAISRVEGAALPLTGELADNQFAVAFGNAAGLLRSEMEQEPVALAERVSVPSLVIQGLKDMQVRQVDGRNLAGALPAATLLEFPDLAHNLNDVRGDPLTGALPGPDTLISATLVRALTTWLNGHL